MPIQQEVPTAERSLLEDAAIVRYEPQDTTRVDLEPIEPIQLRILIPERNEIITRIRVPFGKTIRLVHPPQDPLIPDLPARDLQDRLIEEAVVRVEEVEVVVAAGKNSTSKYSRCL